MRKAILLSFLLAFAVCQSFDFDDCSCDTYNSYYAISCPVTGIPNSGVKWNYNDLPDQWYATDEVIYAPRNQLVDNEIYGCKLQIVNAIGGIIRFKKTLLFSFLNGEIRHVTDLDYDYNENTIYNSVISTSHVVTYPTSSPAPRKTLFGGILGAVFGLVGAVISSVAQILGSLGGNIKPYFPYGPHRNVVFRGDKGSIEYQLNPLGNLICGSNRVGSGAGLKRYSSGILGFKANLLQALLNKKYPY